MMEDGNKKYNSINKISFRIICWMIFLFFLASLFQFNGSRNFVKAEESAGLSDEEKDEIEEEIEDKEDDVEDLEAKARNYRRMIDLKQQQQATLQNQLKLMDIQAQNIENNIEINKDEIDKNKKEIGEVEKSVVEKEKEIEQAKNGLQEILRTYDRIDKEMMLEILSNKGDFSSIFNSAEYLSQASKKVEESLEAISKKKEELNTRKAELEKANENLVEKKEELEEKVYYLNNEKNNKELILDKTKGEENKYQELLERVEQQKQQLLGDIQALSQEIQNKLSDIKSSAKKPTSGLASTKWYYAQDDKKWGYNRIGLSSSLLKDYGCAVTSLAMVFTYHGEKITPGKLASQPIFYRDLIVWPGYWKGIKLASGTAHGSVSWKKIDDELDDGYPVIVFVKASAGKGHYVVIHGKDKKGKYVVHDPLFGPNIFLETTKDLVGAIYKMSTVIDQAIVYH